MKQKSNRESIDWCIERHRSTNHHYDGLIPYEFHLRMVAQAAEDFEYLCPPEIWEILETCCFSHDTIEDTRTNYNDVVKALGKQVADITYALTNEKGRNRDERGNEKYYEGIRNTPGATFVKLADRIANTQYSKMTRSSMFTKYKAENEKFIQRLTVPIGLENHPLKPMFDYLIKLFED